MVCYLTIAADLKDLVLPLTQMTATAVIVVDDNCQLALAQVLCDDKRPAALKTLSVHQSCQNMMQAISPSPMALLLWSAWPMDPQARHMEGTKVPFSSSLAHMKDTITARVPSRGVHPIGYVQMLQRWRDLTEVDSCLLARHHCV